MTALLPARRRAEEFADVIDGTAPAHVAERHAQLLRTVAVLERQASPELRPEMRAEFSTRLRERLMLAADEHLAPRPVEDRLALTPRAARPRERRLAAAAVALVIVGGGAGMATAAQHSAPGDPLYSLKLGLEQVRIQLSTSDSGRGHDYLDQASSRLGELRGVVRSGNSAAISRTLADYRSSAAQGADLLFSSYQSGSDPADVSAVSAFAAKGMAELASLRALAPASTYPSFASTADLLAGLDQQSRTLCASCAGSPVALPSDLMSLTSAQTFDRLVTRPAAPLPRVAVPSTLDPNLGAAAAEAARAAAAAAAFPPPPGSTTPPGRPAGATLPVTDGKASQSLQNLVTAITSGGQQVTDPVTSTLTRTLTGTTEKLKDTTHKITDPLTGAVDQGLGTDLGGLLP